MVDYHLFKNGSSVVGNDGIAVGRHEHLVHSLGSKGGLEEGGDSASSHDFDLKQVRYRVNQPSPFVFLFITRGNIVSQAVTVRIGDLEQECISSYSINLCLQLGTA